VPWIGSLPGHCNRVLSTVKEAVSSCWVALQLEMIILGNKLFAISNNKSFWILEQNAITIINRNSFHIENSDVEDEILRDKDLRLRPD
jgi:hypothetical protein